VPRRARISDWLRARSSWRSPTRTPISRPKSVATTATVTLERDDIGPKITSIALSTEAVVPGLAEDKFQELVQSAKEKCPISRLYAGTEISVTAKLLG
jgi:osmotically inducible protein OsmC